ncbi:MAG: hypothetical protein SH850_16985 [Planctomycetaceae bacterium]|nr:hypothetical protein [Planctomycetaceae bacterium]
MITGLGEMTPMYFEIIGDITQISVIACGQGVKSRAMLRKRHGVGAWRKLKGIARIRLFDGTERRAEVHWYEAHGIGKKDFKIKRFVD